MKKTLPLVRTMQLGFGAVVVILLIMGAVAYRSVIAATASERLAQHTLEVVEHLANLRALINNIENAYRDFALSGDSAFLQLNGKRLARADVELIALRALTADNPRQQQRLLQITDLERRIIAHGDSLVRLRNGAGARSARDAAANGEGEALQADFRPLAQAMEDEERGLLLQRAADGDRRYRQSRQAIMLGSVLTVLIAIIAGWMVPRGHAGRLEAIDKLRQLNRLYAMVSAINALGIRVHDRGDLYDNACRIAVEDGEFLLAWIGIVDRSDDMIVPTAWAGANKQAIDTIRRVFASADGALSAGSMAAQAIRGKATVISNNVRGNEMALLRRIHVDTRIRSIAVFPLIVADQAIGVLVLHTSKPEFFDAAGLRLLTELADNVAVAVDHIEKQERLDHLAYYDALTGLANRSLFLDRVNQHILRAHTQGHLLAVCLIDLERFRKVNDTLGRPAGDALLKLVSDWLVSNVGGATALARVGADHFALVLPEVRYDGDAVRTVEQTISALLQHPFRLNDLVYRVAVKLGVALYPDDGLDADTLFRNAESALKKTKVSGERYLFYAQKMGETLAGSLGIENRLREALEKQQFVLHYQPKVNIVSGKLTGAEALIRWNDPESGLVPPDRFIPILEQTGLIHDVGRWALTQALLDYQRWRSAGLQAVRIAVNVSALQLRNHGFVAEIERAISVAKGAAAGLELEITESLVMEDVEHSVRSLRAIRALGVTIAIDDFGTGFSSLSYLARLPVDTLKIDRSFVVAMGGGPSALTLVAVIINLAHALKLNVIAEGVETAEQLRQLRLLDCDEMQGFLYGKPVPVEVFEQRHLAHLGAAVSSKAPSLLA